MIQQKRYERIAELVNSMGVVDTDTLCSALGASRGTVRRDLITMEEDGLLKRTRGGAQSIERQPEEDMPIHMRRHLYSEQKERIAISALDCIHEGDTVLLGAGTTVFALASHLSSFSSLTVLTYDIGTAYEVASKTNHTLLLAGGTVKKRTLTLVSGFTEAFLRDTHIDCCFFSADALDAAIGFMDYNADEITLKRIGLHNASRRIMLLNQSKLGDRGLMTICKGNEVDLTIMDGPLTPDARQMLESAHIKMRIV